MCENESNNAVKRRHYNGNMRDRQEDWLAFGTLVGIYCKHAHPRKNKTFDLLDEGYYGVKKTTEVIIVSKSLHEFFFFFKYSVLAFVPKGGA